MCLRVADVMENDPERTPEVILKHRLISADSLKFWLKDKRFNLIRNGNKFTVYARPEKAYLHKAIEETAQWIEDELKLCDELIKIKPLNQSSFTELRNYSWNIDAFIHKDITPKENTYVYIQGAFRPNTAKILELLGGNQLYGNSIWAYRELIQNSFDAVKEKMAHQIINEDRNPKEFLPKLGDLYSIDIVLEIRNDGYWLVCKDQGVGMTKSIIEKFFLESGSSKRHEINELERKCKEKGFNFSRTGQFGIGVLSYFMIAEKIIVKTKRELNTGYHDSESVAWRFEINGAHDFGELSKYNKPINGTEIEIKLKADIEKDILEWDKRFSSFLKKGISKSPCNITYLSKIADDQQEISFGWSNNTLDIKKEIVAQFEKDILSNEVIEDKIITSTIRERLLNNKTLAEESVIEMQKIIDFLFDEGEIEGLGHYRIYIPYFKLAKGYSFYYLKEEINSTNHSILRINDGHFWRPEFNEIRFSLKGIRIKGVNGSKSRTLNYLKTLNARAYIEIDIEAIKETCLSVSRHTLVLEENFSEYKRIIDDKVMDLISKHGNSFDNCYGSLNNKYTHLQPSNDYWAYYDKSISEDGSRRLWKEVVYPICAKSFLFDDYEYIEYRGNKLHYIEGISSFSSNYSSHATINWLKSKKAVFNLGTFDLLEPDITQLYKPIQILTAKPISYSQEYDFELNVIELPTTWDNIILFSNSPNFGMLLNINSKYYKFYDFPLYAHLRKRGLALIKGELVDEKHCFAFLLNAILNYQKEKWLGLSERRAELMQHVFNMLEVTEVYLLEGRTPVQISLTTWEKVYSDDIINKLAPLITEEIYLLKGKSKFKRIKKATKRNDITKNGNDLLL